MNIVAQFIQDQFLPERQVLLVAADDVLAKYAYDDHLAEIEMELQNEVNLEENSILKDRVNSIYKDHLTKVLLAHGIDVYAYVTDISLLTNMLDAIKMASEQMEPQYILNLLPEDGDMSEQDLFARLVSELTTSSMEDVMTAILKFNDTLMENMRSHLRNMTPMQVAVADGSEQSTNALERYRKYIGPKRTGIVYMFLKSGVAIGMYDVKKTYLVLEDLFATIKDNNALRFEIISLVLASETPDSEVGRTLMYFARVFFETPALSLQFINDMKQELASFNYEFTNEA